MAHTKSGGSTKLGRESASKRLGVKIHDGETVHPGQIIIRQRGSKYLAGRNVKVAGDDTLLALKSGVVKFNTKKKIRFDRSERYVSVVSVVSA
ncbi:MAG: 50S ribosomal protein L27 [Candidatus Colwellbacteria bacterium RIFCSPHIGHO2_12_FULL_43_12]|uniref:Large ribosomal subunit protein bL27 n=2 Tax=Candidatus Colwelliibacteriota TaxID=1817904 RepID=A0A1G1Z2N7_9BACT|nr:MAG: 50S ribosomal protein L27 [Candidatus Colwellbacteria bacterium RIFCSPHIGHO2_12_FULL_43_12]OGY60978.1 MAG: 50S ribosomal protein L27 [Candidatus Colwellbacteria bacterium RIFCSPLOWO2_12_FULL_43_11]